MIPVVSFIGRSESGKTTLLESVIAELKLRGYRTGVVKHAPDGFDIDHEGKDTWRFAKAGAKVVALASPGKIAFVEEVSEEPGLDRLQMLFEGKVDILITEGYKSSYTPKILVLRRENETEPLRYNGEVMAALSASLSANGEPRYHREDILGIVDILVKRIWESNQIPSAETATPAIAD